MWTRFLRAPIAVAGIAGLAACQMSTSALEEQDRGGQAIVGGSTAADLPGVGYLALLATGDDGSTKITESLCTATLIAPRVVLTAAHCLRSVAGLKEDSTTEQTDGRAKIDIVFGVGERTSHEVTAVVQPFTPPAEPAAHKTVTDMAYLVLATALDVPTIAVDTGAARQGCGYTTVGFGFYSPDVDSTATTPSALPVCNDSPADPAKPFQVQDVTVPKGNICHGDSGSPLIDLSSGTPRIVGVLSGMKDTTTCGSATTTYYYAATSHNAALVAEALAAGNAPAVVPPADQAAEPDPSQLPSDL